MNNWLTLAMGETYLHPSIIAFAKSAPKGGGDDDDDEDEDDEDEDDEDDEDDDPDEGKSDEELRAELKKVRVALKGKNDQSLRQRKRLREREAELEAARKPKPKTKGKADDDEGPDLDELREEARREGAAPAILRAKKAEAKSALLAAGVSAERVAKAVGLLDLDELDLDDDGLDGIEDAVDGLKSEWPELFATKRRKRQSVAGDGGDRDGGKPRAKNLTPSERQALQVTRGGR